MKMQLFYRGILLLCLFLSLGISGCALKSKNRKPAPPPVDYTGTFVFYFPRIEQADWDVISGPLSCALVQKIPEYGEAKFMRKPQQGLTFSMTVLREPKHPGNARLISRTPTWREKEEEDRDLGTIPLVVSKTPFYLHNGWARRLLAELQRGMNPLFRYTDWADGRDQINVTLSSATFMPAWRLFQQCEQGLLHYVFDDVRHSVFQYEVNQTKPGQDAQSRLMQLTEYTKLDPDIKRIQIDGYTDSKGFSRINLAVAKKRVNAIKEYFIAQGIDSNKIKVKAHNEKVAKYDNRTSEGRRKNRRVEVMLIK